MDASCPICNKDIVIVPEYLRDEFGRRHLLKRYYWYHAGIDGKWCPSNGAKLKPWGEQK